MCYVSIPRSFLVIRERLYAHPVQLAMCSRYEISFTLLDYYNILKYSYILYTNIIHTIYYILKLKLLGLSPRANYTDRAAAAGRRS